MNKLKVIFFGTPDFVIPVMDSIHNNFQLVGVVTTPDALVGRKQILTPSPIAQKAEELKIPVLKPTQFTDSLINQLTDLSPDLFIVASYGKIIPQSILDIPKLGSINIHPSRLPLYRGASPIQSQLLDGVIDSGISFILMDAEMDHGPIIQTSDFSLQSSDTFQSLHYSMFKKAAENLPHVIEGFMNGTLKPIEQDDNKATICGHITRESGYFDIENPPTKEKLDRMIRAFYPWPSAWTRWNGKIVKFLPNPQPTTHNQSPYLMQMEGKNPVTKKEFLNGFKDFPEII
jgi:methionyl-tRNA formyltransferase